MITKTEIAASRTDSITARQAIYAVARPALAAGQRLGVSLDRTGWTDAAASITLSLEISQDGGVTWRHWCGYTDKGGAGLPASDWTASAPPAGAAIRLVAVSNGRPVKQPFALVEVT